jgi:hypothetical protein
MAFNVSRGANGLRPEGARELSPGFTLGKLPPIEDRPVGAADEKTANHPS